MVCKNPIHPQPTPYRRDRVGERGLSHCRCQDQWTARTLWAAKAAREAEANLCMRRTSASPTASASGTFSLREVWLVDSADSSRVKVGALFGSNFKGHRELRTTYCSVDHS